MHTQPPTDSSAGGAAPLRTVPWLVFDGDCAFCTSAAAFVAQRLHRDGHPDAVLVPWQFTDLAALGTTAERTRREVLWVRTDGSIAGGAEAFAAWLLFRGGPFGVAGAAMGLPVARTLAGVVYRWIARHRDKMPGGSPACALPPPGYDPSRPGQQAH